MKRMDCLIAALFLLLGLYALFEARKIDVAAGYGLGAGFFPFWLGVSITVLGSIVLFQILKQGNKSLETVSTSVAGKRILVVAALFAFVSAVGICGFVLALSLLVAFLLLCIERETWWRALVISAATGVGFHLFFVRLLEVELPKGPWNF